MRRFRTAPVIGVGAIPDHVNIDRAHALAAATARPLKGGRGAVGYDRSHPTRTFTGPVFPRQNVDAALSKIAAADDNIHYRPPSLHDAALVDTPLGPLQRIQYERMLG